MSRSSLGLGGGAAPARSNRSVGVAAVLVLGLAATVGTALLFQHVGGYIPCALCLQQRTPYYVALPVALLALVLALAKVGPAALPRILFAVVGLLMLWGMSLAIYHAGVEWQFWAGPTDCASGAGGDLMTGDLLGSIDAVRPPACDRAAGRFLGLSFAGWNVLASAFWALVALWGAARGGRAAG